MGDYLYYMSESGSLQKAARRDVEADSQPLQGWYCLRSLPKSEHIAASHLSKLNGIEVFCPRIRFKRGTERGPMWVTEALFPGYLFARFEWMLDHRRVRSCPSIRTIVHFGDQVPLVPDDIIHELRSNLDESQVAHVDAAYQVGAEIILSGGVMDGLRAVVTAVFPSQQRLKVLFSFLGQPSQLYVPFTGVIEEGGGRTSLFAATS